VQKVPDKTEAQRVEEEEEKAHTDQVQPRSFPQEGILAYL